MSNYVYRTDTNERRESEIVAEGPLMPARAFFFVTVDEIGREGVLVRHTYTSIDHPNLLKMNLTRIERIREVYPERKGLWGRNPDSLASIAEHVLGEETVTSFVSTSADYPEGATRFNQGKTVYVDIAKAKRDGAKLITPGEIDAAIDDYVKKMNSQDRREALHIKKKSIGLDTEVLVKPNVSIGRDAIFSKTGYKVALGFEKWARVVNVFGVFLTGYDIGLSAQESVHIKSIRPLEYSVLRNLAGWEGSLVGSWAGAALGARMGGTAGMIVGIETGPGALITGAVGGIIGGAIGFFAEDYVLEHSQ
jgi:hypothetical protein